MTQNLGDAVLRLSADDTEMTKGLERSKGKLASFAKLGPAAVGAAFLGIGVAAFKAHESVDEALGQIRTATGKTGAELRGLENDFRAVFGTTIGSAEEVAGVIGSLNTTLGLTGSELQSATRTALEMADALGVDATESVHKLAQGMNAFGVDASQAGSLMDKLFVASQATDTSIDTLTTTIGRYGANLSAAGFSMDESIALIAQMEAAGIKSRTAMSGLSTAITYLSDEAVEANDTTSTMNDLLAVLFDRIGNAETEAEALSIAADYFGTTAGPQWASAIRNGAVDLADLTTQLGMSEGAVMTNAEATRTLTERFEILRNQVVNKLAEAAGVVLPIALDAAAAAFEVVKEVALAVWSVIDAYVMPVLRVLWGYIEAYVLPVLGTLADIWLTRVKANLELVWDFIDRYIIPVIDTLATVYLNALTSNLDHVVRALQTLWAYFNDRIYPQIEQHIIPAFRELWQRIQTELWPAIRDELIPVLQSLWRQFNANIIPVIRLAIDVVVGLSKRLNTFLKPAIDFLLPVLIKLIGLFLRSGFNAAIDAAIVSVKGFAAILRVVRGVINTVRPPIEAIIRTISSAISKANSLLRRVSDVKGAVGGGLSGIGDFIGKISPFASGGIVTGPTLGLVGEAGPEAIIPLDRLRGVGGGGPSYQFNIENIYGFEDFAAAVDDARKLSARRGVA